MSRSFSLVTFFVLLLLPSFGEVFAFVHNRSSRGDIVKWNNPSHLTFNLNASNADGLSESAIANIATQSFSQWQSNINFNLNLQTTSYSANGRNDIYFADSTSFFSDEGIVAVTAITYNEESSTILETDIVFNDSKNTFSTTVGTKNYVGDVLSHELGHSLGLSHSQVFGSTMFYRTRNGQATIEKDDISGVKELYQNMDSSKGSISGKVVGSTSLIPVFGAHVSAISQSTGQVVSADVSLDDGTFFISGLDLNDVYYIYTQPLEALSTLPLYYNSRRVDFCENRTSYRGSFFQSCLSSERGFPQGIEVSSSNKNLNIGYVSIKCGLDTPTDYMLSKTNGDFELNIFQEESNTAYVGEAYVGYFSRQEVAAQTEDVVSVKLGSVNWSQYSNLSNKSLYLEVKTITQAFYSSFKTQVTIENSNGSEIEPVNFNTLAYDSEFNPDLNVTARYAINSSISTENDFTIKIKPKDLIDDIGNGVTLNDIVPSSDDFMDSLSFYLLTVNIVEKTINELGEVQYVKVTDKKRSKITDNKTCADANYTYQITSKKIDSTASNIKRKSKDTGPLACGSIDISGSGKPPSSGPMSMVLFVMLCTIFTRYKSLSFLTDKYHNRY